MSWFATITFILCLTFIEPSAADNGKKQLPSPPPSAVVVGTVFCDTCFQENFSKTSHFISGASVAVECEEGASKPSFRKEAKTNRHGEFRVHLPFSISKHVRKIKGCSVTLVNSSEPYCSVASAATSSSLRLKSRKQGVHIFSAGFFTFKPLQQPDLCNQKPTLHAFKQSSFFPPDDPSSLFPSPLRTPDLPPANQFYFPPLPLLPPLPQLPPLPPLPGLPRFPPKSSLSQKPARPDFFFPPIIPSPPPASVLPLPPNPFQPPSVLPPNPFQPPPPLINLPPIPGLTPSPPPSAFPFPLPPLPFPAPPRIPGIPPASSSSPDKGSP